jgi:hypothetical protein
MHQLNFFMAAFNNIFQVESFCMEAPSICAQHVEQLFMPLDSPCTFGWVVVEIFYILVFTPYDTCKLGNWIWFRLQRCVVSFHHLLKGIHHEQKIGANHQHVFFMLMAFCSLAKTYKDGVTLCMHPTHPNCTCQCTQHLIYCMEMQHDVWQVICEKSRNGILHSWCSWMLMPILHDFTQRQ